MVVLKMFLGIKKSANYKDLVETLHDSLHLLGCNMSIKIRFLTTNVDEFPANLGDVSDENDEHFHQDIKVIKERYQDTHTRWQTTGGVLKETVNMKHSRCSRKREFVLLPLDLTTKCIYGR